MAITRKDFLKSSSAAALAMMLPQSAAPAAIETGAFPDLVAGNLPGEDELWNWLGQLADWCPASTGGPGHTAFVNFLDAQLRKAKLTPQRKTFKIPYWDLKDYSLKLGSEKIHATSYRPYGGSTGPAGVSAPLYYAGMVPKLDFSGAAGKIALVELAPAISPGAGKGRPGEVLGTYPPGQAANIPNSGYGAINLYSTTPDLKPAQAAGAAGVIYIWNNVSDANAEDQAHPFTGAPNPVPALWVTASTGQRLKGLANSGASITLTVDAPTKPDTPTDNLWAVLPGKTDETIVVNTHTDGCNCCEENGGLGVVALAQYFSKIPLAQRNRTLLFLMTTGHFAHGYVRGTQDWMNANKDVLSKTVACVTIEHLGATCWLDDPVKNVYKPTGEFEWGPAYTPIPAEGSVFIKAAQGSEAKNIYAFKPEGGYPGEGAGFWRAGIPVISYLVSPQYLFIAPARGRDLLAKLDKRRFHGEIVTLTKCVAALDKMSAAEIKGA